MGIGRPLKGSALVERFDGSQEAKERLRAVMDTLNGSAGVGQACEKLGISEARFYQLRDQVLQEALNALEPQLPGRPRKEEPMQDERVKELEARIKRLELELQASHVRTQLALTMPEVLRMPQAGKKRRSL